MKINSYNENKKEFQLEENLEAQIQEENDEPIEIEVEDRGMNTDELPPEELQRLVDNNRELKEENDEPIEIEVEDRGMNTDELPPEELQRLVDNNIELKEENEVTNLAYKIVDKEK